MLEARRIYREEQHSLRQRKAAPSVQPRRWLGPKARLLSVLAGCFILGLLVIAQYCSMVTLSYQISQAKKDLQALEEEYRELEQVAMGLSSPSRVESVARNELGMQEPSSSQLRVIIASGGSGSGLRE